MNFGSVLYAYSRKGTLEPAVWNSMKPWLIRIARQRAKACIVKFVGFNDDFSEEIKNCIQLDNVDYKPYTANDGSNYALLIWDSSCKEDHGGYDNDDIRFCNISNISLEITFSHAKEVNIVEKYVTPEMKRSDFRFIS